jgi:hypothetical protein
VNPIETLQEARNRLTREVVRSARENDGWPGEADDAVNDVCRDVIRACFENYGEAWLGHVNLYDDRRVKNGGGRDEQIMWKWDGAFVCNFEVAFVAPKFDAELVRLIRERDAGPYTTADADYKRIEAIHERLAAIGGVHLFWT